MKEVWKSPFRLSGYAEVSNLGRVRSLPRKMIRKNGSLYTVRGRNLKLYIHKSGLSVLVVVRPFSSFFVGRLVLESFVGPCPKGMECCHNDGDPLNNKLNNLRWDTHRNNEKDKIRHGTHPSVVCRRGEDVWQSKLTKKSVKDIRKLYQKNVYGMRKLSKQFGVTHQAIHAIVTNRAWKHVQ
jgi:hypothetical protein